MERKKVLFIGDGVAQTGFARVNHNIIKFLPKEWDIHHLAVNYYGDPHNYTHKLYPASLGGDVLGYKRLPTFNLPDFDLVFILNDIWVIAEYLRVIKKSFKKIPPIVVYYPVDGENFNPVWFENFELVTTAVVYTQFGKDVSQEAYPEFRNYEIVPHGTDTKVFFPLDKEKCRHEVFPNHKEVWDSFIVQNSNRNQPRKRIDIALEGFSIFSKGKPSNILYHHHAGLKDQGWDIASLVRTFNRKYDIKLENRLIFTKSTAYPPDVPVETLNKLYNVADINLNTSTGEGWGLCVDPETEIYTENGSTLMRDISVGDKVLTETGEYQKVKKLFSRKAKTYNVTARGMMDIKTTEEHPFLVLKNQGQPSKVSYQESDAAWVELKDITVGDFVGVPKPKQNLPLPEYLDLLDWINTSNIQYNDEFIWNKSGYSGKDREFSISALMRNFSTTKKLIENARKIISGEKKRGNSESTKLADKLLTVYGNKFKLPAPIKVKRFIKVDNDLLEFLGWYLAEGWYTSNKVGLSLSIDEIAIAEKFKDYLLSEFNLKANAKIVGKTKSKLICNSSILGEFLTSLCGKGAKNKVIHKVLMNSSTSLAPLVKTLFFGDGHKSKQGTWKLSTVSEHLAWQVANILRANDIFATVAKDAKIKGIGNYPVYYVGVGGYEEELFEMWTKTPRREVSRARAKFYIHTENFLFTQIRGIEELSTQEVMDIEVENIHSFVGNGYLLHNCNSENAATNSAVQIVPNHSACRELYTDCGYLIPINQNIYSARYCVTGGIVHPADVAASLEEVYEDAGLRKTLTTLAYEKFTGKNYLWKEIVENKWTNIFIEAMS